MVSQPNLFRSYLKMGGIGLLALSISACGDERVSQQDSASQAIETTKAELIPAVSPPPPPVPAVPEPMPHYNVHFAVGSARLSESAKETLTSAVDYLRGNPFVAVKLSGFTDLLGSTAMNMKLAEQRVASAALFLEQNGINRARITTIAVGETDPSVVPDGEKPATWNRRVEIEINYWSGS